VERLRLLAEADRRGAYVRDGYLSMSSWFAQRHRVAFSQACGDLRMARALREMARTNEAASAGAISMSAARMLVAAREADPDEFRSSEPFLVEAARRHEIRDLHRVIAHWRLAIESRRARDDGDDELRQRRRLHVSPTMFGMVRIDGDLDPETGETVLTALGSAMRTGRPNSRTPARSVSTPPGDGPATLPSDGWCWVRARNPSTSAGGPQRCLLQ
jgi:hypothetical protein